MRAMILAAGRGTRLRPLSDLLPKPAMPVRGLPVIAGLLALLQRSGVDEVVVNLHHLPDRMREAAERHCPPGLGLHFSSESELLGTGGGIRRAAAFLRESDPSLVISGDMILDADLAGLVERHRAAGNLATLLLHCDPRAASFGSVGVDREERVRRIGRDFDLGGETASGVFLGVRCFAARAFETLPERDAFEDLRDWLAPRLARGDRDIAATGLADGDLRWEPVGTPAEYLSVNFDLAPSPELDAEARARGVRLEERSIVGAGAEIGAGTELERVVVWDGERVPGGLKLRDGVYAGGRFHRVGPEAGARVGAQAACGGAVESPR